MHGTHMHELARRLSGAARCALPAQTRRPPLGTGTLALPTQDNEFKIRLKELEDNLLFRLSNAQGDILQDVELIENLETTKQTSIEIGEQVQEPSTRAHTHTRTRAHNR